MQTRRRDIFPTIRSEGGILPADLLQRIVVGDKGLDGLDPASYHLAPGEKINEAVNRAWSRLVGAWNSFRDALKNLPQEDPATTTTRERWLQPLFQELGYGRLQTAKAVEIEGKSYAISHAWGSVPIHLVGCRVDIDRRTRGVAGAAQANPHGLLQELLNRSDSHLWGFISNGKRLRILRDNKSLTRQSYVEFDLESMMEAETYPDFTLLWLLCHQSRVEGERPELCWLEAWSKTAQEQGARVLDQLRDGVEEAITALGKGVLTHAANRALKTSLRSGALTTQDYYRQLLRLVYQLIFLFVAEDRDWLLDPNATAKAKELYQRFYSIARLRQMVEGMRGTRHGDLYRAFRLVVELLGKDEGCPELALPALGSFLFSTTSTANLNDCEIANYDLLDAIRALAFTMDNNRRRPVDYKNLHSEELGSVYESLLELYPELSVDAGTFALRTAGGSERKTTGSYYTPDSLVQCLLDSALEPVLNEAARKPDPEKAILDLKICDPACGSGHFLIAAAHRMAKRLAGIRTGDEEPSPEATRTAIRDVIGHCLYGVDLNEMAVELCKVALWMEALEPGKPLSFLDHRIRHGNSLLGATPALLDSGIPDDAFTPIEGDDRQACSEYRKRNKKEREGHRSLFDAAMQPWERLGDLAAGMMNVDLLPDDTIQDVHRKQERYESLVQSTGYLFGHLWADAWCAAFVWTKARDERHPYPITEEYFRRLEKGPYHIAPPMRAEIERLARQYQFFHWHLAFPDVFYVPGKENPENEQAGWSGGFDVVLGNPPWEHTELKEKEWFATRRPDIAEAQTGAERKQMIEALVKEDPALYAAFLEARRSHDGMSHFIGNSCRYPLCGRGRINTYATFAETNRLILGPAGRVGCIVPSGIATDDTTKFFFQDLMNSRQLLSLYDFENREGLFPAIDSRMKFCLLTLTGSKRPAKYGAEFVFFAHKAEDLLEEDRWFTLSAQDLALLNPNTRTCPIFRSKRDAELTKGIYERVPVLMKEGPEEENPWGISFRQGLFNMTSDSHLFRTREQLEEEGWRLEGNRFEKHLTPRPPLPDAPSGLGEGETSTGDCTVHCFPPLLPGEGGQGGEVLLPLYEAKMIHHFDHRWATYEGLETRDVTLKEKCDPGFSVLPRYWVLAEEVESRLGQYKAGWLLGFRDITNTTNERTSIFGVMPRVGVGHTCPLAFLAQEDIEKAVCFVANLDSFIFDYATRQKVGGTHLTYGYLKQLPILPPSTYEQAFLNLTPRPPSRCGKGVSNGWEISHESASLAAESTPPFPLREGGPGGLGQWILPRVLELTYTAWDLEPFARDCGYDGPPFRWDEERRFLLRCELDAAYFHLYGIEREEVDYMMETFPIVKRKDEGRYGEYRTKRVILEIYEAMERAMEMGKGYETVLDPPPADLRVAHAAR